MSWSLKLIFLQVISCQSSSAAGVQQLQPFVPAIWQQLFRHCECAEEGTRNVVAECLGKLTLIDPENLLRRLQESLNSPSALMRTTVVTAVKFTISDQVDSALFYYYFFLYCFMETFLCSFLFLFFSHKRLILC